MRAIEPLAGTDLRRRRAPLRRRRNNGGRRPAVLGRDPAVRRTALGRGAQKQPIRERTYVVFEPISIVFRAVFYVRQQSLPRRPNKTLDLLRIRPDLADVKPMVQVDDLVLDEFVADPRSVMGAQHPV